MAAARLLDPANDALQGQARVNAEIFSAVEIIGRKLERVEAERDALARRLALIESSALVDEATGKLYLPALVERTAPAAAAFAPRWVAPVSFMTAAIALFALGLALMRPEPQMLTKDQLAALDALSGPKLARITSDNAAWKHVAAVAPEPQQEENRADALPDATALAQMEQAAAPPQPVALMPEEKEADAPAAQKAEDIQRAEGGQKAGDRAPVKAASVQATEDKAVEELAAQISKKPDVKTTAAPEKKTAQADDAKKTQDGLSPDKSLTGKLALLQERAYQGVPEAEHDLATVYAAGNGAQQDYTRAIYWFKKAAAGGIANAHYNLGVIYHQGLGVPADIKTALGWYEKAAELGHPEALYNLGIAYIEGVGTETNVAKGVSYFKRAAKAGVTQAAYNLGVLYESNFIGPIDLAKAKEWYGLAADKGHADAQAALARLGGGQADVVADMNAEALTLADKVEPAAGEKAQGRGAPARTLLSDIQDILVRRGFLPKAQADGNLNPQTEDAIRAVQERFGLPRDGQPSQEVFEKLLQAPPAGEKVFP